MSRVGMNSQGLRVSSKGSASGAARGKKARAAARPKVRPQDPSTGVLARIGGAPKRRRKKGRASAVPIAARVDRHRLYELSVQTVDAEIDFVDDTYKTLRGRRAKWLREDFCGTANTSCEWVRRRPTNRAIGVDLDPEVQAWGAARHVSRLKPSARKRIALVTEDVRTVRTPPIDIVLAMNFSYWLFKTRDALRGYFKSVLEHLGPGGMFILDGYGGYEASKECRERRTIKERGPWGTRFTYIWDQAEFDPVSASMTCHIHFAFEDGSRMNRAFTYHWRLWTLPEIREVLAEAGFARSTIYWEGWDEKVWEGNGDFQPVERGEADAAFIVYIVAEK